MNLKKPKHCVGQRKYGPPSNRPIKNRNQPSQRPDHNEREESEIELTVKAFRISDPIHRKGQKTAQCGILIPGRQPRVCVDINPWGAPDAPAVLCESGPKWIGR